MSAEEDAIQPLMQKLLEKLGIPPERAANYAAEFVSNGVDTPEALMELSDEELKEDLGVRLLGDRAKIRSLEENYIPILQEMQGDDPMTASAWGTPDMTEEEREDEAARAILQNCEDGRLDFGALEMSQFEYDGPEVEEVELASAEESQAASVDEQKVPLMNIVILIVGSRGDVQPFVALGQELVRFGHRVRLGTHEVFRKFVVENDIEFYPLAGDPKELMAHMVKHPGLMPGSMEEVKRKRVVMKAIIESCWDACIDPVSVTSEEEGGPANPKLPQTAWAPNAVLSNPASFGHYHVAERLGCPLHIFFTMPWSPTAAFPHPLANLSYAKRSPMKNKMSYSLVDSLTWSGLGDLCNSFRKNILGLEPILGTGGRSLLHDSKIPHAYTWSPHLIGKPRDWGKHIDITGFFFLNLASGYTPPDDLMEFLKAGPPPIYVGFGSIVVDNPEEFNQTILDAFKATKFRGIVSKGWSGLGCSGDVPDDVYVIGNCPHDWLFLQCAAVCHHGGAGTTAAGLLAGRPSIVCPFFGDQPFWGQMIANCGVGPPPIPRGKKFNVETLANAFRFCMLQSTQDKAKALGEQMRKENGIRTGVQVFHAHLPLDDICCDVDEKLPATVFCADCRMKLADECHAVIHDPNGNRKGHRWFRYGSCNWKPAPPGAARGMETAYTGAWHIGLGSLGGLVSKPSEGYKKEGAVGLVKGIGQGTAGVVAAPFKGTAYFFKTLHSTGDQPNKKKEKKKESQSTSAKAMQVGDSVVEIPRYGGFFMANGKEDWKGEWKPLSDLYDRLTKQAAKEKGHAEGKIKYHRMNPSLPNIDHVPKQRRAEIYKEYCMQLAARTAEREDLKEKANRKKGGKKKK